MTVCGAVTRKNVRVAPATALSASSRLALRRSRVTGVSRNCGSKTRLMPPRRAMAVKTSRLLASRKTSEPGILMFRGDAVFDDRFLELPESRESPGFLQMIFARARFRPLEAFARAAVVGIETKRLRELDDGEVVVAAKFGA